VRKSRVSHKNEHFDFIGLLLCERYVHHVGMRHRYARVSTDRQSVAALTAAEAVTVSCEVTSGAKTDGAKLRQMLTRLAAGDVLLVTRLDRNRAPRSKLRGDSMGLSRVPPSMPHSAVVTKTLLGSAR
jgi:Resolvase, N terminal domain